jgi:ketose-bisphosphate aldolase|tara:strand:+ start:3221 stop:4048 length:828 start_codon:yes stop_codon:yes gene_type:complete
VVKVNGISLLREAQTHNYIVPGFNVSSIQMAKVVLEGAKQANSPIFLQTNPININNINANGGNIKELNELVNLHPLPVALHLDHAKKLIMFKSALMNNYSSFMADYSEYTLEKNIKLTINVKNKFTLSKFGFEAELGIVGGQSELIKKGEIVKNLYTDPEEATYFIKKTNVNSLAISIGSMHGIAGKINKVILKEINNKVNIPLVVHGGSGLNAEHFLLLNKHGIKKINFGTALHKIFYNNNQSKKMINLANINSLKKFVIKICNELNSNRNDYK